MNWHTHEHNHMFIVIEAEAKILSGSKFQTSASLSKSVLLSGFEGLVYWILYLFVTIYIFFCVY